MVSQMDNMDSLMQGAQQAALRRGKKPMDPAALGIGIGPDAGGGGLDDEEK